MFVKCNWIICLTEDVNTARCLMCLSYLPFLGQQPDIKLHQQYISRLLIDQYRFLPHLLTQRKMKSIEYFHSRGQHISKFIGTKESVCIRKEFNSQRTDLGNMATVSLFWDTNMAAVTSCENTLYVNKWNRNWELPADESDSRIRSIALVSDWNKFIFSVSPKKERFEIIIHY